MALLIPDTPGDCVASEKQVFDRLERDLDRETIVLHSVGLVRHRTKLTGEADFVVLSPKGVFVLEVKGGHVSCTNGKWRFENPDTGEHYEKTEGPFRQAEGAMFALKAELERAGLRDLLIGYGVVMPRMMFDAEGPEIERAVLLDARGFGRNLGFYIGALATHWDSVYRERHGTIRRTPTREEIRRLRVLIRPDVEATPAFGTVFTGLEQRMLVLTDQQVRAARGVANNPRTVVTGRAGTGKTIVAMDRVRQLATTGANVLYVCFNQLLARHVAANLAAASGLPTGRAMHIHALYSQAIRSAGMSGRLAELDADTEDFFGRAFPELFVEAALRTNPEPADVLVIDEAQDLLTPEHLDALDLLVKGGLKRGSWHLFLDPLQNIYGKRTDEALEILRNAGFASYELFDNCRNTREVATQCSVISGVELALDGAPKGPDCECVFYADRDDFLRRLRKQIRQLLDGGAKPRDLVVLSTRQLENSLLAGHTEVEGLRLHELRDAYEPAGNVLHFTTMHAFKGLERRVVLAIDLDRIGDERAALLHYAGLSRAIALLKPFVPETAREAYAAQAMAFGRRIRPAA